MGSSASMFKEQLAADIYLQDIWSSQGNVRRIAIICVSWGMSIATIEQADALIPGRPGPWTINNVHHHLVAVQDFGLQHLLVPGMPNAIPNTQPPGIGQFVVNGKNVLASRLPWHHHLIVRALDGHGAFVQLHYHKHAPRKDHRKMVTPKIRDKDNPKQKHWIFDRVSR